MSQKFSGESKSPKLKWQITVNDDQTLNFTVKAKNLRVREERGECRYWILNWPSKLPLSIRLDGHEVKTHIDLKLWSEISDIPAMQWGRLHKLANRNKRAGHHPNSEAGRKAGRPQKTIHIEEARPED